MRKIALVVITLAVMLAVSPVYAYVYFVSDFNGDTLANRDTKTYPNPRNWTIGAGLTKTMCPDLLGVFDANAELGAQPWDFGRVLRIHDPLVDPNNQPVAGYPAHIARPFTATTSGTVTLTFDILFMQQESAFIVRLCSDATASTVASWATTLIFEGADNWANPGGSGWISYMSFYDTSNPANSVYNRIESVYFPYVWYTVKIEANWDTRKWRAYMGYKGDDPLAMILDWTDMVYSGAGQPGTQQATKLAQVLFQTSNKAVSEGDGVFYVDNVKVEGPVAPTIFNRVADAHLADKGAWIQLSDKLVTAGNDQLPYGMFYIQDDANGGAGIRVRCFNATVHEGDRVDFSGLIAQVSDNGTGTVLHNAEREIQTDVVTVHPSHEPAVEPVFMLNSMVGGGWFGPDENPAGGPEPKLKGVWPQNSYGNVGVSTYANGTNKLAPLFNVGTLVKVSGVVTRLCSGEAASFPDIYISDGSLPWDGARVGSATVDPVNPAPGIRIKINSAWAAQLPTIQLGDHLCVTGIAGAVGNSDLSTFTSGSGIRNIRVVRARKPGDIVKVSP